MKQLIEGQRQEVKDKNGFYWLIIILQVSDNKVLFSYISKRTSKGYKHIHGASGVKVEIAKDKFISMLETL